MECFSAVARKVVADGPLTESGLRHINQRNKTLNLCVDCMHDADIVIFYMQQVDSS